MTPWEQHFRERRPQHYGHHREGNHEQQGPPGILFYCFAAVLLGAILFLGMPVAQAGPADRRYRDLFLILTGALGAVGGLLWGRMSKVRPEERRLEDRILTAAAICLPAYALLQCIPLPLGIVALFSPARAQLARSIEPVLGSQRFASLSVTPAATFTHFLLLAGYAVTMFAAREFAVRARRKIWIIAAPVLAGGLLEAALALLQFTSPGDNIVKGTFAIRNHLAGFLEMALPLALGFGMAALAGARDREDGGRPNWLRIAGGLALAALIFTAGLVTLSRGGFGGIFGSLLVMAVFSAGRGMPVQRRLLIVGGLAVVVIGLLFVATPLSLIARLAQHDSEGRLSVWGEGINVVRAYPLVGAGLGGFESAFLKYKVAEGQFIVDYAHNDYLQGLAELGIAGFAMVALFIGSVVVRSARMALGTADSSSSADSPEGMPIGSAETRWAGLACLAAVVAILIHSAVDFNLYVPANGATFAWICGMAAGLTPSHRRRRRIVEVPEDLLQRPAPSYPGRR